MKQTRIYALLFILSLALATNGQTRTPATAKTNPAARLAVDPNAPLTWYTNLAEAQQLSNASKKPIFGFFTGSDWCGWCHKLQNEVFSKKAFIDWARKNVILLEIDFPRNKQLEPELKTQNNELQQFFKVQGYPTVWLFTAVDDATTKKKNISQIGSLGYPAGATPGKEEVLFLENIMKIMPSQKVSSSQKKKN